MYDERFMRRAIEIARDALAVLGVAPFGAVVVKDGVIVGEGVNLTGRTFDPTAHGEVEAIRAAATRLGTSDLSSCDLYTSCEPCALCVAAMHISRIRHLYFGASIAEAADAFAALMPTLIDDVDALRRAASAPASGGRVPAEQKLGPDAVPILREWASLCCASAPGGSAPHAA